VHYDHDSLPHPVASRCRNIALRIGSFDDLCDAYVTLQSHGVALDRAMDHVNPQSIYLADPDGNRLEIYYEVPGALRRWPHGRGDGERQLGSPHAANRCRPGYRSAGA
jgi:catechol-2,3-dioxygenase